MPKSSNGCITLKGFLFTKTSEHDDEKGTLEVWQVIDPEEANKKIGHLGWKADIVRFPELRPGAAAIELREHYMVKTTMYIGRKFETLKEAMDACRAFL